MNVAVQVLQQDEVVLVSCVSTAVHSALTTVLTPRRNLDAV